MVGTLSSAAPWLRRLPATDLGWCRRHACVFRPGWQAGPAADGGYHWRALCTLPPARRSLPQRGSNSRCPEAQRVVGVHAIGFVSATDAQARDAFFRGWHDMMAALGPERGWAPPTRAQFDALRRRSLPHRQSGDSRRETALSVGNVGRRLACEPPDEFCCWQSDRNARLDRIAWPARQKSDPMRTAGPQHRPSQAKTLAGITQVLANMQNAVLSGKHILIREKFDRTAGHFIHFFDHERDAA